MPAIRLYNFAKKRNSTKQPTGGTVLNGEFRGPVDVLHPVIRLTDPAQDDQLIVTGYNYAYIGATGRYYWIRNITAIGGRLFDVQMDVDVLATYRGSIGASGQYILRAASAYNQDITDTLYPMLPYTSSYRSSFDLPWIDVDNPALTNGYFVVGIANDDANAVGSVSYYVMPPATFAALRNALMSTTTWTGMDFSTGEISEALYKSLYNPYQYIVSCKWFPLAPTYDSSTARPGVKIGWWPLTFGSNRQCYPLKVFHRTGYVLRPRETHYQADTRGNYLNTDPYFSRALYIEPFGTIPLDTAPIMRGGRPLVRWWVDFVTGAATVRVETYETTNPIIIGGASGNIGVDMSVAQVSQDVLGGVSAGLSAVSSLTGVVTGAMSASPAAAVGGVVGGAVGFAQAGISAARALTPTVQIAGANGSILPYTMPALDICTYTGVVPEDLEHRGRPLCDTQQIDTLSGYILCADAHIEIARAMSEELDTIVEHLNTGFYYE